MNRTFRPSAIALVAATCACALRGFVFVAKESPKVLADSARHFMRSDPPQVFIDTVAPFPAG